MNRVASAVFAASLVLIALPAGAQGARTLDTFVTEANRVPLNPTAMLRSDARRLAGEFRTALTSVRTEVRTARETGRTPPACPAGKVEVNPQELLRFLNAIPQAQRVRMTPTDGIRAWLASRYPCPAT